MTDGQSEAANEIQTGCCEGNGYASTSRIMPTIEAHKKDNEVWAALILLSSRMDKITASLDRLTVIVDKFHRYG